MGVEPRIPGLGRGECQDDQAFTVPPAGVDASPGFSEDIALPPGTYLARLSVRELRDGSPYEIAGAGAVVYLSP